MWIITISKDDGEIVYKHETEQMPTGSYTLEKGYSMKIVSPNIKGGDYE